MNVGPGEPILSLLKQCIARKIDKVDLLGTDPSPKMLELAEARLKQIPNQHPPIRFGSVDQCANEQNTFDVILSALVLIYAPDQGEMLRNFHRQLRDGGLLITAHWPHPNQVPFLTLLKQIGTYMATGKRIALADFEPDGSFSLWAEEPTRALFAAQGFRIQQWTTVDLPMPFPNIRTFLSFCRIASWFGAPDQYARAEAEVQRILRDDYHLNVQPDEAFALPSKAVVIVASK